mmetsp:Transcript_62825/g.116808  ORF Transcript_62825/g.116808 Transcript_62825/m.116808 type:complete len:716 (-) Transcript_62825:126-2273(-)
MASSDDVGKELEDWPFEDLPPAIKGFSPEGNSAWQQALEACKAHIKEMKKKMREENFLRAKLEKRAAAAKRNAPAPLADLEPPAESAEPAAPVAEPPSAESHAVEPPSVEPPLEELPAAEPARLELPAAEPPSPVTAPAADLRAEPPAAEPLAKPLAEPPAEPPAELPAEASSTPSAASGKGAGKGKAGKGPALPKAPPPAPPPRTSRASIRGNGLTNVFWKASHEPDAHLGDRAADAMSRRLHDACLACPDDDYGDTKDPALRVPPRPQTVFTSAEAEDTLQVPSRILQHFFQRSQASSSGKRPLARSDSLRDENSDAVLQPSQIQMLEITVKKHLMDNKGLSPTDAIRSLLESILHCDYSMVTLESLNAFHKLLDTHIKEGSKITNLVQEHGEEALERLRHPEHHQLVYELLKLPDVVKRIECMIFTLNFEDNLQLCTEGLATQIATLNMLQSRKEAIQRFFVTAHRFGQALNRDSNAPKAERGFQLSTLEKLAQTKSTKYPRFSMMHFVLALLSPEDARDLFSAADVALLQKARALTTHKVRRDTLELVQGLYSVHCSLDHKTAGSRSLPEDNEWAAEDRFYTVMSEFLSQQQQHVTKVGKDSDAMVKTYKKLGILFDDLSNVWPPPKNASDGRLDLCDVFCRFAENVMRHREEVEQENLRSLLFDGLDSGGALGSSTESNRQATTACTQAHCESILEEEESPPSVHSRGGC